MIRRKAIINEVFTYRKEVQSTCHQLITQDDADEVTDLTGDSETTSMQYPEFVQYNKNNNELQFLTNLFMNITPESVEDLP